VQAMMASALVGNKRSALRHGYFNPVGTATTSQQIPQPVRTWQERDASLASTENRTHYSLLVHPAALHRLYYHGSNIFNFVLKTIRHYYKLATDFKLQQKLVYPLLVTQMRRLSTIWVMTRVDGGAATHYALLLSGFRMFVYE
jgi:hypothetical protein